MSDELNHLIAQAGQFQDARMVLEQWLHRHDIYLAQHQGWHVVLGSQQWKGQRLKKESFPTFGQALAFALSEAERRIAASDMVQPVDDQMKREGAGDA